MSKKNYEDDDGRTIADMSGIDRPPMLLPRIGKTKKQRQEPEEDGEASQPRPEEQLTGDERRGFIFGALGATLLIAAIFVAAAAIAILLMTVIWR